MAENHKYAGTSNTRCALPQGGDEAPHKKNWLVYLATVCSAVKKLLVC
jgi:hypothetical protein